MKNIVYYLSLLFFAISFLTACGDRSNSNTNDNPTPKNLQIAEYPFNGYPGGTVWNGAVNFINNPDTVDAAILDSINNGFFDPSERGISSGGIYGTIGARTIPGPNGTLIFTELD